MSNRRLHKTRKKRFLTGGKKEKKNRIQCPNCGTKFSVNKLRGKVRCPECKKEIIFGERKNKTQKQELNEPLIQKKKKKKKKKKGVLQKVGKLIKDNPKTIAVGIGTAALITTVYVMKDKIDEFTDNVSDWVCSFFGGTDSHFNAGYGCPGHGKYPSEDPHHPVPEYINWHNKQGDDFDGDCIKIDINYTDVTEKGTFKVHLSQSLVDLIDSEYKDKLKSRIEYIIDEMIKNLPDNVKRLLETVDGATRQAQANCGRSHVEGGEVICEDSDNCRVDGGRCVPRHPVSNSQNFGIDVMNCDPRVTESPNSLLRRQEYETIFDHPGWTGKYQNCGTQEGFNAARYSQRSTSGTVLNRNRCGLGGVAGVGNPYAVVICHHHTLGCDNGLGGAARGGHPHPPHPHENILLHEMAHMIMEHAIFHADRDKYNEFNNCWEKYNECCNNMSSCVGVVPGHPIPHPFHRGGCYACTNRQEFWAVGSETFFGFNKRADTRIGISTIEELKNLGGRIPGKEYGIVYKYFCDVYNHRLDEEKKYTVRNLCAGQYAEQHLDTGCRGDNHMC